MRFFVRSRMIAAAAALAVVLAGGRAFAGASCGTILTNTASITMWSGPMAFIGYELSYNVTATVRVICPVVNLSKYASPTWASAGGLVTFYVCVDNQNMTATGSVWNLYLQDVLPNGMAFETFNPNTYPLADLVSSSYSGALNGVYTVGSPPAGQYTPLYLRWVLTKVGVLKSACVSFSARVL